jgi:membrane protease YdiL (CAAX protease family)
MRIWSWMGAHPVRAFFALTFVLSWGGILALTTLAGSARAADPPGWLFAGIFGVMTAGPMLAGLAAIAAADGRAGLTALGHRVAKGAAPGWYAFAVLTVPITAAAILGVLSFYRPVFTPGIFAFKPESLTLGVAAGLLAGFMEEIGWTGCALDRILVRHSVVMAGLVVGVIHGFWHFLSSSLGDAVRFGPLFLTYFVVFWVFGLMALRVLIAWAYRRTGSLHIAQLLHASYTIGLLVLWPAATTASEDLLWTALFSTALWVVAALTAFARRSEFFGEGAAARRPLWGVSGE